MSSIAKTTTDGRERALLVQVILGRTSRDEASDSLTELERLSETAGAVVLGRITQRRSRPTAKYLVGEGKLDEIRLACLQTGADLVIFDNDLTPTQVNNLDLALGVKVIDRTELILQIFARRARSAEAQIQVELAQLQYLISRIPVSERQQRFKGGIGMRGPGESPLQLRNEPMRRRIRELQIKLERVRDRRRRTRLRRPWPLICLVGYTNAGKSTLLRALTGAETLVDDRLFATLDTKSRIMRLPSGRRVMVTDTVGFIRNLPHTLVASFQSTLEETTEADLLLVVTDIAHPYVSEHLAVVQRTLDEIGGGHIPSILVLNKCDIPGTAVKAETFCRIHPGALPVSARSGMGIEGLKLEIEKRLATM